jgi:hypothetical protein
MEFSPAFLIPIGILFLSAVALLAQYKKGNLLSSASGTIFQIAIFYGIGGLAFLTQPKVEPRLTPEQIVELTINSGIPFLIGYGIVTMFFIRGFRNSDRQADRTNIVRDFPSGILFLGGSLGFLCSVFEGDPKLQSLWSLMSYFRVFIFPCLLLSIAGFENYDKPGKMVCLILLLMTIYIGFTSAWRSILVLTMFTIFLGIATINPRHVIYFIAFAAVALSFMLPFQLIKRDNFERFQNEPMAVVRASIDLDTNTRLQMIEEFICRRMNYTREMAYIDRALSQGFPLSEGQSYINAALNLIPRTLWPEKPSLANYQNYELPRLIGLLQATDKDTSWGINMFAEGVQNFGVNSLPLFIPLVFLFNHGLMFLLGISIKSKAAFSLGRACLFFLSLCFTSVIFAVSTTIACFLLLCGIDRFILVVLRGARRDKEPILPLAGPDLKPELP